MLNHFEEEGMTKSELVTAIATALHADTDGAAKGHVSGDASNIHGYAVANKTKIDGARKTATNVPMLWANH